MENKQERKRGKRVRTVLLMSYVCIVFLFLWTGCDEQPVSVGEGILPDEDFVQVDTLFIDSADLINSFSFDFPLTTSGSPNILVGQSEEHRVESIFRFTAQLANLEITRDLIETSEIFDATLFFRPSYVLGDTNEVVSVDFHEVLSGWAPSGFSREVYESLSYSAEPVFSGSVTLGTTDTVAFSIPEAQARDLFIRWADQSEQSIIPQGLIIRSGTRDNGIIGFHGASGENQPELRLIFGTEEIQDTVILSENVRAFAAYLKKDLNFSENIVLQAGVSTHAVLQFDLDQLPQGAIIHSAELKLTRNEALSIHHPVVRDSLFVYGLVDPNKFTMVADAHQVFTVTEVDTLIEYRSRVSDIVQEWVTRRENYGFIIRDNHETLGLHRTSFYTETAEDPEKRPMLKIIYSPL